MLRIWRTLRRVVRQAAKVDSHQGTFEDEDIRSAWKEQLRGDFSAALAKWEIVLERSPHLASGYCGVAVCARALGRLDYAYGVVECALRLFPDDRPLIAEAAQIEERRGDWNASVAFWERIVNDKSARVVWLHCYVHDLLMLGRHDQVETLLSKYRRRFPNYAGFFALQGMLAAARQDLDESVAIWSEFRRRFPDDPVGWEHYGRAYQARELARLDAAESGAMGLPEATVPEKIDVVDDEGSRALLLGFESIGVDCEFGLVQRRYGAEPLGLLRFNAVSYGGLLAAISQRFDQMGEPSVTELHCQHNGEYLLMDRRWGLAMHTFVFKGQTDADALYSKLCRRVAFLKDKLLSDFAEGKKVFVFLSPFLGRDDLLTLHRALQSLGRVRLLHVRLAGGEAQGFAAGSAGEVIRIDQDLFVGYLPCSGRTPDGSWDIAFDAWVDLCRQARSAVEESKTIGREYDAIEAPKEAV
jgi:tetratricopeptide (TPR) repeat protein